MIPVRAIVKVVRRMSPNYGWLYCTGYRVYNVLSRVRDTLRFGWGRTLFPVVTLETSTFCNRKCGYCPNSTNVTPKEYMDELLFRKIIDELAELHYNAVVHFNFYNEPLLDPRIPDLIKYASGKLPSAILKLNSNGDYLDESMARRLTEAGLTHVLVTLHDNKKENRERLEKLQSQFTELVQLRTIFNDQLYNRGGAVKVRKQIKGTRCISTVNNLLVTLNGDVLLCCNDYYRKHVYGNVKDASLLDVWFKDSFVKIRRDLGKGIVEKEICRKCLGLE